MEKPKFLEIYNLLLFVLVQKVTKKSRNPETRYAQTAGFRWTPNLSDFQRIVKGIDDMRLLEF